MAPTRIYELIEPTINELSGKLKISTSNPLRQKMTGISRIVSTRLAIPDSYIGVMPIEADDSYFFNIKGTTNDYTLFVEYEFTNNSDSSRTIYNSRLSVRCNEKNFNDSTISSYTNVGLYDTNNSEITSLVVPAHSSAKVRIFIPKVIFAGDSLGYLPDTSRFENKRLTMTLMFYIMTGNQRYSFFSEMIRLRNY